MDTIAFITLSTSGYIKYTLNCLESLARIDISSQLLHTYMIGKEGHSLLTQKGYRCSLIDEEQNSNFQQFRSGNWGDITFHKFTIIYKNLLDHKYVCFTDGDIVFEKKDFMTYLQENIESYDMLIQSEGSVDFCSGFMFIQSNETTLSIFNPENVKLHKRPTDWDDQVYLNEMRIQGKLNYKLLPLPLFPNGLYYYNNSNLSPYLIHFNWLVGHQKEGRMKHYGKWYTQ